MGQFKPHPCHLPSLHTPDCSLPADRKWGSAYLTRAFFSELGERMADRVLLVLAETADGAPGHGRPVAGALNLIGSHALFGRNWGCIYGDRVPNLHFEVGHAGHAGLAGLAGLGEATRWSCVRGGGRPAWEGHEVGCGREGQLRWHVCQCSLLPAVLRVAFPQACAS